MKRGYDGSVGTLPASHTLGGAVQVLHRELVRRLFTSHASATMKTNGLLLLVHRTLTVVQLE